MRTRPEIVAGYPCSEDTSCSNGFAAAIDWMAQFGSSLVSALRAWEIHLTYGAVQSSVIRCPQWKPLRHCMVVQRGTAAWFGAKGGAEQLCFKIFHGPSDLSESIAQEGA